MNPQQQYAIGDMLAFTPNDHDVRVARGKYVYWVRGVRRGSNMTMDVGHTAGLEIFALYPIIGLCMLIQRRARWKVGVVRVPAPASWTATQRTLVLHKELLDPGVPPDERIAALADDVQTGRYDRE